MAEKCDSVNNYQFSILNFQLRTLFLNLASHHQLIALTDDQRTLVSVPVESRTGEEHLLPLIEKMLREAGMTFQNLDRIAATTGPGGFMSLRVGIALANALSDSLSIPLAGVHGSEVWHSRVESEKLKVKSYVWLHSTKQNLLFIREFEDCSKKWPIPTLISIEDLHFQRSTFNVPLFYVGELIESQRLLLPGLQPMNDLKTIEDVLPAILAKAHYEKKSLLPWYGRGA